MCFLPVWHRTFSLDEACLQSQSHHSCRGDVACPPNCASHKGPSYNLKNPSMASGVAPWPLALSRESAVLEANSGWRALNLDHHTSLGPFSRFTVVVSVLPLSLMIPVASTLTRDLVTGKPWSAIQNIKEEEPLPLQVSGPN